MIIYLQRRAKTIVATLAALLEGAQVLLGPNDPRLTTVMALVGAFGVWFVPNAPPEADFWHDYARHRQDEPPIGSVD